MSDWQPIETAPLKQRVRLRHSKWGDREVIGIRRAASYWWEIEIDGTKKPLIGRDPTHWMPLPPLPKESKL